MSTFPVSADEYTMEASMYTPLIGPSLCLPTSLAEAVGPPTELRPSFNRAQGRSLSKTFGPLGGTWVRIPKELKCYSSSRFRAKWVPNLNLLRHHLLAFRTTSGESYYY